MAETKQPSWGHLEKRFGEKAKGAPRKLLALDGGGIRGVMTLQVLIRMEEILRERSGQGERFRLCNFFDYIGGTSTGAIIAAGLAIGMSAQELSDFYIATGPKMFEKAFILERLRNLYKKEPLTEELKKTYGAKTDLGSSKLKSLLLVVTRNVTTDSPWPISSNPFARYNRKGRKDCNLQIPLWQLVRASTAAPVFFPPEVLQWDPADAASTFLFEDGGLTPYNNPAFLIARMATQEAYGLGWRAGENHLLVVSVGTGSAAKAEAEMSGKNAVANLVSFPGALMYGAQVDQDINCRTVGRCVHGAPIDRELGDLVPRRGDVGGQKPVPLSEDLGRQFLYARYNAELSQEWLSAHGLGKVNPADVSKLDSVEYIPDLVRVGRALAKEVRAEHFALERFGQFY
jgi:predicted acylesterase/phospholipase RssA